MGIEEIRAMKSDDKPEEKKVWYRIPKFSRKEKAKRKVLRVEYGPYLEKHPYCAIRSPDCQNMASCVNHTKGRGENVLNQEDWEPSCGPCNTYIESHHAWAEERGHKKRQIT